MGQFQLVLHIILAAFLLHNLETSVLISHPHLSLNVCYKKLAAFPFFTSYLLFKKEGGTTNSIVLPFSLRQMTFLHWDERLVISCSFSILSLCVQFCNFYNHVCCFFPYL